MDHRSNLAGYLFVDELKAPFMEEPSDEYVTCVKVATGNGNKADTVESVGLATEEDESQPVTSMRFWFETNETQNKLRKFIF